MRDRILEVIRQNCLQCDITTLNEEEFRQAWHIKLQKERKGFTQHTRLLRTYPQSTEAQKHKIGKIWEIHFYLRDSIKEEIHDLSQLFT